MATLAVEVVYRGIFQKTLARNIVRSIVFAAPQGRQNRDCFRALRRLS